MPSEDNVLNHGSRENTAKGIGEPTRRVEPLRVSAEGGPPRRDPCDVVVEDVLTIAIEGVGKLAVMCTPSDTAALAVGFLFAEGLIADADDIAELTYRTDPHVVTIRVVGSEPVTGGRDLIMTSSCGLCGSPDIDSLMAGLTPGKDTLRISPPTLRNVAQQMRDRQDLFAQTGGSHAAAIFSATGEIVAMGEDIGRHNALDKAVGKCLLDKRSLRERGVMLSGRSSLEMLAKAAQAGLEVVAAVSAPTSLAIEVAQRCNITLCGFVRADRATVYTHPHRIQGIGQQPD
ncbi:MAG: formate dehydrogenase accessory sulfurtransferase FdhD [Planctomycetota bacterium]|jgi:FdhD protein